jgi:hypothetical protein
LLFQTAVPVADTIAITNTANAPAAGAVVVQTAAAPPAGIYKIILAYLITGAQETAVKNVRLVANGAALVDNLSAMTLASAVPQLLVIERITLNGTNLVQVTAAANSVALTVYTASLFITRIG